MEKDHFKEAQSLRELFKVDETNKNLKNRKFQEDRAILINEISRDLEVLFKKAKDKENNIVLKPEFEKYVQEKVNELPESLKNNITNKYLMHIFEYDLQKMISVLNNDASNQFKGS